MPWSFDEWRGCFLSRRFALQRWLEFYSHYLPAVEVDSTFYSIPSRNHGAALDGIHPGHISVCLQIPREITHVRRLRDCGEELAAFFRAINTLESKLQVILIQLPPSLPPKTAGDRLREFLEQLPRGFRFAIEFAIRDGITRNHSAPGKAPYLLGLV